MADNSQVTELIDKFGRRVDYIRLSVTDRCDFRCVYCMTEDMTFLPRDQILSLEELYRVAKVFTELGVKKIRLTGGEPMVRSNVMSLIEKLGALPSLDEVTMTTNGMLLSKMSQPLKDAGLGRINISIDSLKTDRFKDLTRVGDLDLWHNGIKAAKKAGFERIRLNSVVMRGYNEDEVLDLADYAVEHDIDIAFIEEMPLGEASDHAREDTTCSNAWVREKIAEKYQLVDSAETTAGPARFAKIAGHKSRIGFISPVTHNFCEDCNRVRVTVEGRLLLCLGNEHSVDPGDSGLLKAKIVEALQSKPERHHFDPNRTDIVRFMNMTGG